MFTTEEIEKAKQTFPKFTVYICYRGGKTTAHTGEYYATFGKDYIQCTEALKKTNGDFKERQDEDLFNIVRNQESYSEEESDFGNFIARLRCISNDIDNLLNDYVDYEE